MPRNAPDSITDLDDANLAKWFCWLENDAWARARGSKPETTSLDPKAAADRAIVEIGKRLIAAGVAGISAMSRGSLNTAFRSHINYAPTQQWLIQMSGSAQPGPG